MAGYLPVKDSMAAMLMRVGGHGDQTRYNYKSKEDDNAPYIIVQR